MTAIEALDATKRRLIERGWRKCNVGGKAGPNCLVGALEHEVPDNEWHTTGRVAMAALRSAAGTTGLVAWNDAQAAVGPVLALVDKAVEQLKGA